MPEWNLVEAQETPRAHASSKFALSKLIGVCGLGFAVLVLAMQTGCSKIRRGGLDRNILRANDTVPNVEARPIPSKVQFTNDPSEALRELNEANGDFENASAEEAGGQSDVLEVSEASEMYEGVLDNTNPAATAPLNQFSDARIVEGSQQSFETRERGIKLVAIQPPAPSLKNSFEAVSSQPNQNVDRVLLGGVPLSEVEPINPAKVIAQCDHDKCDYMKEKLKPVLPLTQPVQPPAFTSNVPPSQLVSQPLAPILFDEITREVQAHDEQQVKQNQLRGLEQNVSESSIVLPGKLEAQLVPEPNNFAKIEPRQIPFHPTVDPDLGRTLRSPSTCSTCESYQCLGDCEASNRRFKNNKLRPILASEQIPSTAEAELEIQVQPQAPIEIQGQFLPAPEVAMVEKTDYSEFTTEDWTDIFGPPELPTEPRVEPKDRRSDFQATQPISPPFNENELVEESENQFQLPQQNDFLPIDAAAQPNKVELVAAEDTAEPVSWVPPAHTNFSPIPNSVRERSKSEPTASVALENAAKRGIAATFPIVDTHVEIPPPKPEVIVEVVDNTVPWSVKLEETIENVRRQRDGENDPMVRNGVEVNLRLLEVLQRQMVTVEENRSLMPNNEALYWQHQLDAIALMLPSANDGVSDLDRHNTAHQTLDHLRKAVERLESMAALKVSAGKFCTEISGFGKYKPFASSVFEAGQKTLVYCEVENYLSNAHVVNSESSYHTRLRGSYVIYDSQGRVVQQSEYPAVEDIARNRRRDFYMYFPIQIGELAAGDYNLELLVEDLGSNKTAALKPGISFQVR